MNFVVVVPQSDYFHCKHFVMVDIVQFLFTPKKETRLSLRYLFFYQYDKDNTRTVFPVRHSCVF